MEGFQRMIFVCYTMKATHICYATNDVELIVHNAEIVLYKSWRPKWGLWGLFQFEIIINVLISSF